DEFFSDCLLENSKEHQSFPSRTDFRQRRHQEFVFVDHDVLVQDYKHPYIYGNYDILKSWADSIRNKVCTSINIFCIYACENVSLFYGVDTNWKKCLRYHHHAVFMTMLCS
ncbi:unnamed protein product, partial [Schistosoma mattheei]